MKEREYTPDRLWQITLTEDKMRLIAGCVEDCSRFLSGQTELYNTTSGLFPIEDWQHLQEKLRDLKRYVTPDLSHSSSYDYMGNGCPNDYQRKSIAQGYATYKSILHALATEYQWNNVHSRDPLTCEEGGNLMTVRPLPANTDKSRDYWLARDSHGYALHEEKPLWRKWANTEGWESRRWYNPEYTDIIREVFHLPELQPDDEPIRVTLTWEEKK